MHRLAVVLFVLIVAAAAQARTWNVPADAPTIQAGIDSATVGDVVAVAAGTYHENDLVMKPGITLRGAAGDAASVILDGQYTGPLLRFEPEAPVGPTLVEDLTFTRATDGALFTIGASDLTVERCVFLENEGHTLGAAGLTIESPGGAVRVRDCVFDGNRDSSAAAAQITQADDVRFERCLFVRNYASTYGSVIGAGLLTGEGLTFDQCTFTGNTGAGYWTAVIVAGYGTVNLTRTIVAHNEVELFTQAGGHFGGVSLRCCDLYANEGDDYSGWSGAPDNFSADPCFCDPDNDDYRLAADSWCLPGHHPWDGCEDLVGAFGEGCPAVGCEGPVAVEGHSWSAVKARFR
jgi:hypothetical protein